MLPKPEIHIFKRNEFDGNIDFIAIFESLEYFLLRTSDYSGFGSNYDDRHSNGAPWWDYTTNDLEIRPRTQYCYLCYDEFGTFYSKDRLVGLERALDKSYKTRLKNRVDRRSRGRKKMVWGGFRHPKTLQELKWNNAWDDEEFAPKARGRRRKGYLPTHWDDHRGMSAQKSWKWQSKRKNQWKDK